MHGMDTLTVNISTACCSTSQWQHHAN